MMIRAVIWLVLCPALGEESVNAVIGAIRGAEGGFVDDRQSVVTLGAGYRGIVATAAIAAGELLAVIPWSLVLSSADTCALVSDLAAYLARDPPTAHAASMAGYEPGLPGGWSAGALAYLDGLPPNDWTRHDEWFASACRGTDRQRRAFRLFVARAGGAGDGLAFMAPWYDMYNHANAPRHNTRVVVDAGDRISVFAAAALGPGDEIFNSYGVSTPELFRDYGFVEAYPQTWDLVEASPFTLDDGGVAWTNGPPDIKEFYDATAPLTAALATATDGAENLPPAEVAAARAYRAALVAAIHAARRDLAGRRSDAAKADAKAAYAAKTKGRPATLLKRGDLETDAAPERAAGEL